MLGIFSTVWVIGTGFWLLSGHGKGLFREPCIQHFFLCGSSRQNRDLSSQLFWNSDIHVAGEMEICFQTNTLKGVNFIVNICHLMWGLKLCWGMKYIDLSLILIILFALILFSDQGMMENDGLWMQEVEKQLQVKQENFPNIWYLYEVGILNSQQ